MLGTIIVVINIFFLRITYLHVYICLKPPSWKLNVTLKTNLMKSLFKKSLLLVVIFSSLYASATKEITVEDIWSSYQFSEDRIGGVNWMNNGNFYSVLASNDIIKYNIVTDKKVATILSGEDLQKANGGEKINISSYSFSKDQSQILIETGVESIYRHSYKAIYYIYNTKSKNLYNVSNNEKIMFAKFSPDGKKIAYVKNNDLYYTNLISQKEVRITEDGSWGKIINGWADWVYEEEFGKAVAFSWAPDGSKIAYYKFDESRVKEYNMQTWGQLYPNDYRFKYPKAGEDNSEVSVFCYDILRNKSTLLEDGKGKDQYVPRIFWTNTSAELLIFKLNRLQNHLSILKTNTTSSSQTLILEEKNNTYVEVYDDIHFFKKKDQFLIASEKSGYKHFYLYDFNGKLINQVTKGDWDVAGLQGVDEKKGMIYYTSAEISPMDRQLYSINLNGTSKTRMTKGNGTHGINMSPDTKYYFDHYSSLNVPTVVSLFKTAGNKKQSTLVSNKDLKDKIEEYGFADRELFKFKTTENVELNGWMLKPKDFDPNKKYPVLMYVYGGPGSQTVTDSWGGFNLAWYQLLAQKGYIVVSVDNRGTGYRGADFKKSTYGQLGNLECKDQIEGAKYLQTLSFVDKDRIGIWGWSFGGYMTSLCLTVGAEYFKAGVAVAPVTSWRFYDTIYTERFLGLPKNNAAGYDENSPLSHADKLKGNYMLIHGTADDNVHFQNAIELEDALIKANKQFTSFYYPNKNHGIYGGVTRTHLYNMMTNYIVSNL